MNELVLPCKTNNFKPPVKSVSLKEKHQIRGVRLISFDSLLNYLSSCKRRLKSAAGVTRVTGLVTASCGTFNNNEGCTQIWKTGVRYAGVCWWKE
jgi:hypothetical protein